MFVFSVEAVKTRYFNEEDTGRHSVYRKKTGCWESNG
jgi:hypothetical protein